MHRESNKLGHISEESSWKASCRVKPQKKVISTCLHGGPVCHLLWDVSGLCLTVKDEWKWSPVNIPSPGRGQGCVPVNFSWACVAGPSELPPNMVTIFNPFPFFKSPYTKTDQNLRKMQSHSRNCIQPLYSQSSRESATPSSGISPLAISLLLQRTTPPDNMTEKPVWDMKTQVLSSYIMHPFCSFLIPFFHRYPFSSFRFPKKFPRNTRTGRWILWVK